MAQSECNIGVGKGTSPFVPMRDCVAMHWTLIETQISPGPLRELKNCLEEIIPLFSKGDKRGIFQVPRTMWMMHNRR
jgi:hypothetical protein